ncbi:ISAzo13-like element transposase-related protein, partial [Thiorhodovibrio winogradskyi]|uniref:ISAzo13-like element transposase-related protein n=1 Tax=Thiorhodovibrio winogradskyi TaxID=77007 RepID=UPI003D3307FD
MLEPHCVYDPVRNLAFMTLGTSRETIVFVYDAIARAWLALFKALYPRATEILLQFDCGGANAVRSLRFKEDLIALSAQQGRRLRIAHYPPYTFKWNPIVHRLFRQIERRWRGVILDTPQKGLLTVEQTRTNTGLQAGQSHQGPLIFESPDIVFRRGGSGGSKSSFPRYFSFHPAVNR